MSSVDRHFALGKRDSSMCVEMVGGER